ncbi:glutamate-rich protein 6B isoform X2 [Tamandua tetradactyla]|uniref:glutamate-rich protein 6B isoform X2 n=1 Tax=Tamandua tetradactyla TaxID=48850 RepID=UPI004053E3E9
MSAEKKPSSETSSSHLPTSSQLSSVYSEEEDGELELYDECLQEEFSEEYLEEGAHLEEGEYLDEGEYLEEEEYLEEGEYLEGKYLYVEEYPQEGKYQEENKYLQVYENLYEEYVHEGFQLVHSSQTTPISNTRSPADVTPQALTSYAVSLPVSEPVTQSTCHCTISPTYHITNDGRLVPMTDQTTQTEWIYKSKLDYIVSELQRKEYAKEYLSTGSSEEEMSEEPDDIDILEDEDFDDNLLSNTSYQKIFKKMIKEMAARSELDEDIDIPLIGYLETETTKKLGILFKKNFEKYKEAVLWIMRKREKTATFTFHLSKQPSSIEEPTSRQSEIKTSPKTFHPRKKVELDTEWIKKRVEVHHGEGKLILYPNESIFQVLFPDGTGQIHYPSGNLAMLIFCTNIKVFTYIILEDSKQTWIRALINNSGHATFYDNNRDIWLSLSRNLGFYFAHGRGQKVWNWWDLGLHVHAPPVQPISLELNQYVKVHIKSQDKILFCFSTHQQKQIRLNLGTRYKKDPTTTTTTKAEIQTLLESMWLQPAGWWRNSVGWQGAGAGAQGSGY